MSEVLIDRRTNRSWVVRVEPFEMAATTVTESEWLAVVGGTGGAGATDMPVVGVSWRDAVLYCNELSKISGLTPAYTVRAAELPPVGRPTVWSPHDRPAPDDWHVEWDRSADGYRLPTDAEWQVACRAGTAGPRYGDLDDIGWYDANSGGSVRPVGMKRPNPWGLFDTLGGVWEWCWDVYDADVYGPYRVIRGGGWADAHWSCRAGVRRKTNPAARLDDLGLRLVRNGPRSS